MKVARLHRAGSIRIHDEPSPIPGADELLIRVSAVGLCGSDRHWFQEGAIGDAQLSQPLVLGHEFAGVLENGERVAVDPAIPCYHCEACRGGNPNLCPDVLFAGHGRQDGALRDQVAWPARNIYPLPDSMSDAEGALLEPLGVALHAFDLGHVRPAMTVAVMGCGPIGLLVVQLARVLGAAEIYATDVLPERLAASVSLGATRSLDASGGEEWREVLSATHGRGVDIAFEVAGEDAAVESAIAVARPGARVVLGGIPDDDRTTFTASTARRKGLTLVLVRRMKNVYPRAIRLVELGLIDLKSLITHRFPLSQTQSAFQALHDRRGIKIVVEPSRS